MKTTLVLILSLIIMASLFGCSNERVIEHYEPVATSEVSEQTEILNDMIVALEDDVSPAMADPQHTAVPLDEEVVEHVDQGIGISHDAHITELCRFIDSFEQYNDLIVYNIAEPREESEQEGFAIFTYDVTDRNNKVSFQIQYKMTFNNEYCSDIYIKQNIEPTKKEREHFDILLDCVLHSYGATAVEFLGWEGQIGINVNALRENGMSSDEHIKLVRTYEKGRVVAQIKSAKIEE